MSDILSINVGEVWRKRSLVKKADGGPITSGTVNYYLKALTGAEVGNWWRDSDQTWQASETANVMAHQADGNWTIQLTSSPFAASVLYLEYAKEDGDLHVAGEGQMLRGVNAITVNSSGHVSRVTLVDTTTVNSDMRGTDGAYTGTPLDASEIRSAVGLASANLDTQLEAIPTNSELATAIIAGLTTALTEGYRGTGATGSVRDLLYEIMAHLGNSGVSGTTKTLKKLDGTTAKTFTLDSASTPTSISENS